MLLDKPSNCSNCSVLSEQCNALKEEIKLITACLDNLIEFASREHSEASCQTDKYIMNSVTTSACQTLSVIQLDNSSQTENGIFTHSSESTQTFDVGLPVSDACLEPQLQEDCLFEILMKVLPTITKRAQ